MERIAKSIVVNAPLHAVYNQWTQFETFPRFMDGIKEVRQLDDTHLHWRAKVGGKDVEWDAQIDQQIPDSLISWHSTSGAKNTGAVGFMPAGENRTRVSVTMKHDPAGAAESVGDSLGFTSRRVAGDLERFKEFIEHRGSETRAWRGEARHEKTRSGKPGTVTGTDSDLAMPIICDNDSCRAVLRNDPLHKAAGEPELQQDAQSPYLDCPHCGTRTRLRGL
jgi:carbon monoxide dehydrogenase subunit G